MMTQDVLSLFPGIGLLDKAFELEGFSVYRGPDVIWGGDIRGFHPSADKFDGVIGGPPCQTFSALARLVRDWQKAIRERDGIIGSLKGRMTKAAGLLNVNGEATPGPVPAVPAQKALDSPRVSSRPVISRKPVKSETAGDLSKAERQILTALYWTQGEEITPEKIAFYANYTVSSGGFNNALGSLRSAGLLRGWSITPEGIEQAESLGAEAKPTGQELREWLRSKLDRAQNALLDVLCEAHPNRLENHELAERSGYADSSGGFNNAIGRLRSIGAAEGYTRDGGTKAADVFFEGAAP